VAFVALFLVSFKPVLNGTKAPQRKAPPPPQSKKSRRLVFAFPHHPTAPLNDDLVRLREHEGGRLTLDRLSIAGLLVDALQVDLDTVLSCLLDRSLLGLVRLDTVKEIVAALGVLNVLNANVDALGDDASVNDLVYDDSDRRLGDVIDDTSSAMVELVRHTLLNLGVGNDIYVVSDLVRLQVRAKSNRSVLSEVNREQIAGASSVSVGVRHDIL